jgi:hypothetical protein
MAERLTWARARAQRQLRDAATLERHSETQDPDGNVITVTKTLGPYPCRLEASIRLPMERAQGGELVAVSIWKAHLPHGTDVQPADIMRINGAPYEVTDHTDARTDSVDTLVLLKRVK